MFPSIMQYDRSVSEYPPHVCADWTSTPVGTYKTLLGSSVGLNDCHSAGGVRPPYSHSSHARAIGSTHSTSVLMSAGASNAPSRSPWTGHALSYASGTVP